MLFGTPLLVVMVAFALWNESFEGSLLGHGVLICVAAAAIGIGGYFGTRVAKRATRAAARAKDIGCTCSSIKGERAGF